jgi:polyisoprenyl-phosphate glycosyltransferase
MAQEIRFSIVVPVLNEEQNLLELYDRIRSVMEFMDSSWELIFVNDGSTDNSLAIMRNLHGRDSRVKIVDLARRFGHQAGISAGIEYAAGEAVILMDADLQDSPDALPALIEKWNQGYEVVYAVRRRRKENALLRLAYSAFYRILSRLADLDIPMDAGDFSLMDRKVIETIKRMPERSRFIRGLRTWAGFRQVGVECERDRRRHGETKYNFRRLLQLALDGFFGFSNLPLRLASFLGILIATVSCALAVGIILLRVAYGVKPQGWSSLAVIILFLGGVQLITIGILGEYNARIYEEVRGRPVYVLRQLVGFDPVLREETPAAVLSRDKDAFLLPAQNQK